MCAPLDRPMPAYFIADPADPTGRDGHIALWCPWCETVHFHGAGGKGSDPRIESRGAHCASMVASPLAGRGVELDVVGTVADGDTLMPAPCLAARGDPLHTRLRLRDILNCGGIARALIQAVFGNRPMAGFDAKLVGGACHVFHGGGTWWVTDTAGRTTAQGHGLGRLLAELFGVSLGVVAVRVIESALEISMSSEHRLALVDLIDRAEGRQPATTLTDPEEL